MPAPMFATPAQETKATAELQTKLQGTGMSAEVAGPLSGFFVAILKQFGPVAIQAILAWLQTLNPPTPPAGT